jgi:hypothetical protein
MVLCLLSITLLLGMATEVAAAAELEIVNSPTKAIRHVHLAWVGKRKWSDDWLGEPNAGTIAPGRRYVLTGLKSTIYDLRLVDEDDRECEIYRKEIFGAAKLELTNALLEECTRESH